MNVEASRFLLAMALSLSGLSLAAGADEKEPPKATHEEVKSIGLTPETRFEKLSTLCLNGQGNLLAGDAAKKQIKVISPAGKLLATWPLPLAPVAVHRCQDGTIYVADVGKVAKLDKAGKVLKVVEVGAAGPRRAKPSGIAATKKDVFVGFGSGWSLRSRSVIVRFDRDLGRAKTIAQGLRGCCQRLDLVAKDGVLYVAENARHRVVRFDRDGEVLSTWGRRHRTNVAEFGSCCNPMNLCFGPGGVLYTAESGLGRVKRYTPEGKFLGLVGYVGVTRFTRAGRIAASCSNIAIAVNKDGSRVFVQDLKKNIIRVLARQKAPPS